MGKFEFVAEGANVLIVDDMEMNNRVFMIMLKHSGMNIDSANSGPECIEKVKSKKYDIIFLDQMMPGMDGIATLQEMQKIDHMCKGVPVIALTADAADGAREMYLTQGFNDYIYKPIDPDELQGVFEKYLNNNTSACDVDTNSEDVKVDVNILFELIGGDESVASIIIDEYINSAPDLMAKLDASLASRDIKNYEVNVHALKSSSKYIGAMGYADIAYSLELAAKEDNLEFILSKHDELKAKLTVVVDNAKKELEKLS